ncbi:hypothetical protein [Blastococcus sp. CCUG 61487]|uniref:hypothetical protein n=1 Tax=Blastococcus sp. CCUG 61487 TaxID=1840703 RepID=UPI0010C04838|nr:hypothetical protein [Blastococcus sp. CCUG 61487]TKJ22376.1 hypothetical protein A6V29_06360 [Blastococcus sp. CCUG 61487]
MDVDLLAPLTGRRVVIAWVLAAFLTTFLVTRFVTHAIRTGRGPFRDVSAGGVHIHHEVYGIFLLLVTGLVNLTYRPDGGWLHVLAVFFGIGAALTLDEFALWLHLEDVYWSQQGRASIDAVLLATVVGCLLLVGANPFDAEQLPGDVPIAITVVAGLGLALVAILKGRTVLGVVGVFVPVVAAVGAVRLARPQSYWARRWYAQGSSRRRRAETRFPPGRRNRWDRLVDLFADVPHPAGAGAVVGFPHER